MSHLIHARLDDDTNSLREKLQRKFGWNDSQIVREGIRALSSKTVRHGKRKILGQGKFASGIGDLASNPKHMEDYGK